MTTRRDFFKSFAAAGAMVASSSLPALDDPSQFPHRGKFERLCLAYAHVKAGAEKPFSLLHVSDTHFTAAYPHEDAKKQELMRIRTRTFGGRQEEAFADSIAWAKKHTDFLLHTGDLIDWVSEANLDLVKRYFGGSVFGCVGNHEYSRYMWLEKEGRDNAYRARSSKLLEAAYPFGVRFASKAVNGVNFVSLDSVYGSVDPDQVELFNVELKKGMPIILCMHIPFYTKELWRAHEKFWNSNGKKYRSDAVADPRGDYKVQTTDPVTVKFIESLRKEPQLKAILAGHLHITLQERFSPTAVQYVVGGNFAFHGREVMIG